MVRAIYALTTLLGLAAAAPVAAPEAKPGPSLESFEDGAKHAADNLANAFTGRDDKRSVESWANGVGDSFENAADDAKNFFTGRDDKRSIESWGQDIKNGAEKAADSVSDAFTGKN